MSDGFSRYSVDQTRDSAETDHDHHRPDEHEDAGLIKGKKGRAEADRAETEDGASTEGHEPEGSRAAGQRTGAEKKKKRKGDRDDGKHELQEKEAWDKIGYSWPAWKKWATLSSIFAVQVSLGRSD